MNRKFQKLIQRWLADSEEDRVRAEDRNHYEIGFEDGRVECLREILDYLEEQENEDD